MKNDISKQELRKFGYTFGLLLILIFGLLLPWIFDYKLPIWPWGIGVTVIGFGLVYPSALKIVYRIWMFLGNILNWINTRIILGAVFLLMIIPTGLFFRLIRKDLLNKHLNSSVDSYLEKSKPLPHDHFRRPF